MPTMIYKNYSIAITTKGCDVMINGKKYWFSSIKDAKTWIDIQSKEKGKPLKSSITYHHSPMNGLW
jgi:hypothetical protein